MTMAHRKEDREKGEGGRSPSPPLSLSRPQAKRKEDRRRSTPKRKEEAATDSFIRFETEPSRRWWCPTRSLAAAAGEKLDPMQISEERKWNLIFARPTTSTVEMKREAARAVFIITSQKKGNGEESQNSSLRGMEEGGKVPWEENDWTGDPTYTLFSSHSDLTPFPPLEKEESGVGPSRVKSACGERREEVCARERKGEDGFWGGRELKVSHKGAEGESKRERGGEGERETDSTNFFQLPQKGKKEEEGRSSERKKGKRKEGQKVLFFLCALFSFGLLLREEGQNKAPPRSGTMEGETSYLMCK